MKITIDAFNKHFKPIGLNIVIESEEELCNLWHRFNISPDNVNNGSDVIQYPANDSTDTELFDLLDALVNSRKLK